MTIQEQLAEELKQALKAQDRLKLEVVRFLLAEIKNVEIDAGPLDEAGVQQVVRRQIKQIKEAREQFAQGGRVDLVQAEEAKLALLERYLPEALSESELRTLIEAIIQTSPTPSLKTVMPVALEQVAGRATGKEVASLVTSLLAEVESRS